MYKGQSTPILEISVSKLQAEIQLQDQKDDLSILISNTYALKSMVSNEGKFIYYRVIETLTSLKEEYAIGTKTITDLVEEEEKLLNANVSYLNSKKYLLNYFNLKSLEVFSLIFLKNICPNLINHINKIFHKI